MQHRRHGRKFSRTRNQRNALLRNLASQLLQHGRVETSEARAKELRPFVEKLITTATRGDLAARRSLASTLPHAIIKKLMEEVAARSKARPGGYTRIMRLGARASDASMRALIELVP